MSEKNVAIAAALEGLLWPNMSEVNREIVLAAVQALKDSNPEWKTAYLEWHEKTAWASGRHGISDIKHLGKHKADVLREYVESLEAQLEAANQLADFRGRHGLEKSEALNRLTAYARVIAGDINYSGDHPIALAEKVLGDRVEVPFPTGRDFALKQVAELKVAFDLTGLEIGNAAAVVRLPLGNKA